MADNLFGDYIRQRREDAWLTRTELARKANLSVSLIEKIELGTRQPTLHALQILFDHLDVAPMYRRHILDLSLPGLLGPPPPTTPVEPDADDLAELASIAAPASFYTLPTLTIVAANRSHQQTFPGLTAGTSFPEWLFLNPAAREVIVDWRQVAQRCLHNVRQFSPNITKDERVSAMVTKCSQSPDWDELWNSKRPRNFSSHLLVRNPSGHKIHELRVHTYSPEYLQRPWWLCHLVPEPTQNRS
ncbi:helix-turn-helix domain-containing protein [Nocardia tengchongensis]|uniref:helix-turn-helix domain-containing protein n=1 Tax=Nocardia tengchongensis TaxID=2055889 RepID=UPI0036C76D61